MARLLFPTPSLWRAVPPPYCGGASAEVSAFEAPLDPGSHGAPLRAFPQVFEKASGGLGARVLVTTEAATVAALQPAG